MTPCLTTRLYSLVLVCLLLSASSYAQWQTHTSKGYTFKTNPADPMKARFYTLKNGLTVILSINAKEPRIQTLIGVRAGSNNDPKNHTGLAHYLEHLLFKGTYRFGTLDSVKESIYINQVENLYDVYNHTIDETLRKQVYREIDSVSSIAARYAIANEYDKMMADMGAQGSNAYTSVEETVYQEDIPSNTIDKYLLVQAERFRNPVFRLFHTELETVYEEKNRGLDDDRTQVFETLLSNLFPTHNYGQQTTIGTIEHLKNPSLKAIREFYDKYYVPNNMAIVMAGDLDPDYVIKKIDELFSYMKPGSLDEYRANPELPITTPIVNDVVGPDAESVQLAFRLPGALDHKHTVLSTLVSQILYNGKAGLIDLQLNKQQKLLSAAAGVNYWKDYSYLMLVGQAFESQSLEDVNALLLQQLDVLKKGAFNDTLLTAIVNNFKLYELQSLDNNNSRATSLMDAFIKSKGKSWNEEVQFINDMEKVTKQDIIKFTNKYFKDNYVLVYKRKGDKKSTEKIVKPAITPVEVNREEVSEFMKQVAAMPATPVKPMWLDFEKDIKKGKIDHAEVLYVHNESNDLFRLYYQFDMGSFHNKLLPIAASYLQYLGTDKFSSAAISQQFYNIACSFMVSPGTETTTISITGLQENFDKAVKLFEHLLLNCVPDDQVLHNLKASIAKQKQDSKLNKNNIMNGLMQYAKYGPINPFNYQLSAAGLDSLTSAQLVNILHDLPQFKHTIVYYGPEKMSTAIDKINKAHKMPSQFKPIPAPMEFKKTTQRTNEVLFTNYDMVQAEVQWVRNGDVFDAEESAKVELFNTYFGGGMGSIVFQTIRESKALAYSTYASFLSPTKKGDSYVTVAYVGTQADKLKEAVAAMNELLNDIPKSENAFITARNSLKQDIETMRITQDGIIFSYLAAQKLGLDKDLRKDIYKAIDQLDFDAIRAFHASNLANKPYTYCILASDKEVRVEDLKQYGTVKVLTLEEIFGY